MAGSTVSHKESLYEDTSLSRLLVFSLPVLSRLWWERTGCKVGVR